MLKLIPLPNLPLTGKVLITSLLLTLGLEYAVAGIYTQMQFGLTPKKLAGNFSETQKGPKVYSDMLVSTYPDTQKPARQHLAQMEKHVSEIEKHTAEIEKHTAEMEKHTVEMEKHLETMEKTAPAAVTPMPGMENMGGNMPMTLAEVQAMPHVVDLKLLMQDGHVHFFAMGAMNFAMGLFVLWSQISDKWKLILIPTPFVFAATSFAGMILVKYVADGFAWLLLFSGIGMGLVFTFEFFLTLYELWLMPKKEVVHENA